MSQEPKESEAKESEAIVNNIIQAVNQRAFSRWSFAHKEDFPRYELESIREVISVLQARERLIMKQLYPVVDIPSIPIYTPSSKIKQKIQIPREIPREQTENEILSTDEEREPESVPEDSSPEEEFESEVLPPPTSTPTPTPTTTTTTIQQKTFTKEELAQIPAIEEEIKALQSEFDSRKEDLTESSKEWYKSQLSELSVRLHELKIYQTKNPSNQQNTNQQKESEKIQTQVSTIPSKPLGMLARRKLDSLQKDLSRVQDSYNKRKQENSLTSNLEARYQAKFTELRNQIKRITG